MSENYIVLRWDNDECRVYFSAARKGNAMTIHLSADKRGAKHLDEAVEDFVLYIFSTFKWCKMVLGIIDSKRKGIIALSKRRGFELIGRTENADIMMRLRP